MIPLNAILVTFAFTILLSLINLGSTFALYVSAWRAVYAVLMISQQRDHFAAIACLDGNLRSVSVLNHSPTLNAADLYCSSIGAVALKRLRGEALPNCRWSLGKMGLPINLFAFAYSCEYLKGFASWQT